MNYSPKKNTPKEIKTDIKIIPPPTAFKDATEQDVKIDGLHEAAKEERKTKRKMAWEKTKQFMGPLGDVLGTVSDSLGDVAQAVNTNPSGPIDSSFTPPQEITTKIEVIPPPKVTPMAKKKSSSGFYKMKYNKSNFPFKD